MTSNCVSKLSAILSMFLAFFFVSFNRTPVYWLTPQMPLASRTGLSWSQISELVGRVASTSASHAANQGLLGFGAEDWPWTWRLTLNLGTRVCWRLELKTDLKPEYSCVRWRHLNCFAGAFLQAFVISKIKSYAHKVLWHYDGCSVTWLLRD